MANGDPLDGDSYSNPVDMLDPRHQSPEPNFLHQKQNSYGSQSSGSAHNNHHSDESYSNPIDLVLQRSPAKRPNNLEIRGQLNRPEKPRAHLPDDQNIAAILDPTYAVPSQSMSSPKTNNSTPDILEHYDETTAPPYMPIQGSRRSHEKKKKQKDARCNQQ